MSRLTAEALRGIWAGMTMSWDEQDRFDEVSYRTNTETMCKAGVHGIYTTGSTGEFYAIEFDEFRRPADEAELARRRANGLSPRQEELLKRWGYPYVLEEWRFHLTLTGRIADAAERTVVMGILKQRFSGFVDRPLQVRDLCVFRQTTPERPFNVLARFRLGGGRLVSTEVWRSS